MRFSSGRFAIPDAKDVGGGKKFNLIIATCVLPSSSWPIDMLVEGKSVSTEISGPSESRKLSTPVFLVFYISPPVRLAFPPNASAVTPICPS